MKLFYHFPEESLKNYEIAFLPGPNNSLSPYKGCIKLTNSSTNEQPFVKSSALKALKDLGRSEEDLNNIITEFTDLYSLIFTDPDEREDTEGMIRRVKGLEEVTGQTIFVICIRKSNREVVGGFILELHSKSVCLLLTYIFTKLTERGQGLGYSFIQTVLPYVVSNLIDVKLEAVFLETENPVFTPDYTNLLTNNKEKDDQVENNHAKRLYFFRKAGAKWLNIAYTQPKLSTDPGDFGNRVYHLFFLILPNAIRNKGLIADKATIFNFLFKFYNSLEYSDRKKLEKNTFSLNLVNDSEPIVVEDIDLYRSYLQIELLDTLYQFNSSANHAQLTISILELIISLKNQFSFVALEVRKIKEYTCNLSSKDYSEEFIKGLTQLLIEKVTGLKETSKSMNSAVKAEYERYSVSNLHYINYRNLYIDQGNRGFHKANELENTIQLINNEGFYSLSYIRKTLVDIKKRYLPVDTCSGYDAFLSDIPDS